MNDSFFKEIRIISSSPSSIISSIIEDFQGVYANYGPQSRKTILRVRRFRREIMILAQLFSWLGENLFLSLKALFF